MDDFHHPPQWHSFGPVLDHMVQLRLIEKWLFIHGDIVITWTPKGQELADMMNRISSEIDLPEQEITIFRAICSIRQS